MTNITIITQIGTKPRPRFAKIGKFVRTYTPKTALTYERYIASEYQRLGGKYYGTEPLLITIIFYFKLPKNKPKYMHWCCNNGFRLICDNHKDLDNLAKAVLDALNGIAYDDDKQVISLEINKDYTAEQERIEIFIEQAEHWTEQELKEKYNEFKRINRAKRTKKAH